MCQTLRLGVIYFMFRLFSYTAICQKKLVKDKSKKAFCFTTLLPIIFSDYFYIFVAGVSLASFSFLIDNVEPAGGCWREKSLLFVFHCISACEEKQVWAGQLSLGSPSWGRACAVHLVHVAVSDCLLNFQF